MAKRYIVKDGDPTLKKQCRDVTIFDKRLHYLLDDMRETMLAAEGVGLAAPQVGVLKRAAIVEVNPGETIEIINPEIVYQSARKGNDKEGCLSFPGIWAVVERPERVIVQANDRFGNEIRIEGTGLKARALCHEIDHLSGISFIDKAKRILSADEVEND